MAGLFISFEGIDGCGKSTQARRLAARLEEDGYGTLLTREPGGSAGAEDIRRLVLEGATDRWSAEVETLLFTAARRDHLDRTIRPALEAGTTVITDRFADSTRVYQGATRGDLRGYVDALHDLCIQVEPDMTFVLDIDPQVGLKRAFDRAGSELRFEQFGLQMQHDMRQGFLDLAAAAPERFHVIDASGAIDEIFDQIWGALSARLRQR